MQSTPTLAKSPFSLAAALYGGLRPLGYAGDLTDLLGRSGLAFRLALGPRADAAALEDLSDDELADRLAPLGADFRRVSCAGDSPSLANRLRLAEQLIADALSRGLYAVALGLAGHAGYGLIIGGQAGRWLALTQSAASPVSAGLEPAPRLDLLILEAGPAPAAADAELAGLRRALLESDLLAPGGVAYGHTAYARWQQALVQRRAAVDHGRIAALLAESRAHGAAYLRRLAERRPAQPALRVAAEHWKESAATLVELRQQLEWSDQLEDPAELDAALRLISTADAEEVAAYAALRSAGPL